MTTKEKDKHLQVAESLYQRIELLDQRLQILQMILDRQDEQRRRIREFNKHNAHNNLFNTLYIELFRD